MAAQFDPEEEPEPVPLRHNRQAENSRLFNEALAFENRLDAHVDPWIDLCRRLLLRRLWTGLVLFVTAAGLGTAVFMRADGPIWLALIVVIAPFFYAIFAGMIQGLAVTCGTKVKGSEGLAHTCSELKAILNSERAELRRRQEVGEKGLAHYSNHSAVKSLADLCDLRIKGLFIHQRVNRRLNVMNENCDRMLKRARILAVACPLAIVLLTIAAFIFPFIHAREIAPWARTDVLATVGGLTAAAVAASFLPFIMAHKFARSIQQKLTDTLKANWQAEPHLFDSTGPITDEFERILAEWEKCKRLREQMNANANSQA